MPQVILTKRAKIDLLQIWNYLAERSFVAADHVVRMIEKRCRLLGGSPHVGQIQPQLGAGVKTFSAENYVIYFRVHEDGVEVLRIAHGSRDMNRLFDVES